MRYIIYPIDEHKFWLATRGCGQGFESDESDSKRKNRSKIMDA